MRVYSGHIDVKVEGMRARDALGVLRNDIMSILQPFLDAGEYLNPRLFGSIVRGNDTPASDIDILLSKGPTYNRKSAKKLYLKVKRRCILPPKGRGIITAFC